MVLIGLPNDYYYYYYWLCIIIIMYYYYVDYYWPIIIINVCVLCVKARLVLANDNDQWPVWTMTDRLLSDLMNYYYWFI